MDITFSLPYVFFPGSNPEDNARALKALLECLINLDRAFLRNHSVPSLYRSGVVYGRTKEWDTIPALYAKGYGDCKSLSAALIAEYRNAGIAADPVFRWVRNRLDGTDYHILVRRVSGFEDPSKVLGMGRDENVHFRNNRG